ncbi:uncharacterized protein LOC135351666 isoform X3 [Halichondria panicea]|uniref:uncharacterized protein LOC135351666 isoform X3 n=1 Tax=Halichondria panicea TaxID=6063 RepID=UPI00312B6CC2
MGRINMFMLIPVVFSLSAAQTTTEVVPQCGTGFPAVDSLQPSADLTEIAPDFRNIQVITPGIKFECHGQITEWRALVTVKDQETGLRLTHLLYLQVWRPSQDFDEKFDLVGSNLLTYRPRTETVTLDNSNITFATLTSQISENKRIHFQPDDVLGWYSPPSQGLTRGFGVALYSTDLSSELLIKVSSSDPCELYTCDKEVQKQSSLPLITLQYETTAATLGTVLANGICTPQNLPLSCLESTTQIQPTQTTLPTNNTMSTADTTVFVIAGVVSTGGLLVVAIIISISTLICIKRHGCMERIEEHNTEPMYDYIDTDPGDILTNGNPTYEEVATTSDDHMNEGMRGAVDNIYT